MQDGGCFVEPAAAGIEEFEQMKPVLVIVAMPVLPSDMAGHCAAGAGYETRKRKAGFGTTVPEPHGESLCGAASPRTCEQSDSLNGRGPWQNWKLFENTASG